MIEKLTIYDISLIFVQIDKMRRKKLSNNNEREQIVVYYLKMEPKNNAPNILTIVEVYNY